MVKKILIAEDEAIIGLEIKKYLEIHGFSVPCIACTGEEAVETAVKIRPDIIIMDVDLKGELRDVDKLGELKISIIFLSTSLGTKKYQNIPHSIFLLKPFNGDELLFKINQIQENRRFIK